MPAEEHERQFLGKLFLLPRSSQWPFGRQLTLQ